MVSMMQKYLCKVTFPNYKYFQIRMNHNKFEILSEELGHEELSEIHQHY